MRVMIQSYLVVLLFSQREKDKQRGGTSKKTIGSHISDDESSSDSSDEEDSPRPLNYRTPMITQVSSLFPRIHMVKFHLKSFTSLYRRSLLILEFCLSFCLNYTTDLFLPIPTPNQLELQGEGLIFSYQLTLFIVVDRHV